MVTIRDTHSTATSVVVCVKLSNARFCLEEDLIDIGQGRVFGRSWECRRIHLSVSMK
jgi:hypothetical protein